MCGHTAVEPVCGGNVVGVRSDSGSDPEDWRRGISRLPLEFLGWSGRRVMVKGESFSLLPDMHEVWVQIRVVRDADFLWILGGNVWH